MGRVITCLGAAEHLVEQYNEGHGYGSLERRVDDEAEHIVSHALFSYQLTHFPLLSVVHHAASPGV